MPGLDILAAADAAANPVNLWGALGCAVAYSASLLATLDAFADLILARGDAPAGRLTPGVGLKFASKLAAAAIAVIAAGIVLALDDNWFAFTSLTIAFVVMWFAVGVRRLHDRNKSGWWILAFYVLPGVLQAGEAAGDALLLLPGADFVESMGMARESAGRIVMRAIALGLLIWWFVELGCLRGTVGPNEYGPDPV